MELCIILQAKENGLRFENRPVLHRTKERNGGVINSVYFQTGSEDSERESGGSESGTETTASSACSETETEEKETMSRLWDG